MVVFYDLALKIGRVPNVEFKVVASLFIHIFHQYWDILFNSFCSYHNAADKKNNFRVSMAFSIKLDNFD